jgi:hypothetical protein
MFFQKPDIAALIDAHLGKSAIREPADRCT